MTKAELIKQVMEHSGSDKEVVTNVLRSLNVIIREGLIQEERIPFLEIGTFSVKIKEGKEARNPRTGEMIQVQSKRVVKFSPSGNLKNVVDY